MTRRVARELFSHYIGSRAYRRLQCDNKAFRKIPPNKGREEREGPPKEAREGLPYFSML